MTRGTQTHIPSPTDLLCESCGYTLTTLPEDSRCPECGTPIAESSATLRGPAPIERGAREARFIGFFTTTALVLFRPSHFFRHLQTTPGDRSAFWFAQVHWLIASIGFGFAAAVHWVSFFVIGPPGTRDLYLFPVVFTAAAYLLLVITTRLAARLTAWEAAYRGLRLPLPVVTRALHFHSAHYLPVAALAFFTVFGYHWLFSSGTIARAAYDSTYLYVLCGEVILCAFYLFNTYWIGMRNMLYANQ